LTWHFAYAELWLRDNLRQGNYSDALLRFVEAGRRPSEGRAPGRPRGTVRPTGADAKEGSHAPGQSAAAGQRHVAGGWAECQADWITVTDWSYAEPQKKYRVVYTALEDNNYSITFSNYEGSYTYGVLAYGIPVIDGNNIYYKDFQFRLSAKGDNYINTTGGYNNNYSNYFSYAPSSYDYQSYNNIMFKNGYNQYPPNNYYIFGVTWNSNPGEVKCWLCCFLCPR